MSEYQKAKKLKKEGKLKEAITAYRQAIELNPNFYSYHHELGEILAEKEDWEGAIASYQKAIELNSKSARSHHHLGEAFAKTGKHGKAIASYRQAVELNPKSAGFYRSLGAAFYQQGKLNKAANWYLKAVEINPNLSTAYVGLAEVLVKQGKVEEAASNLEKALKISPESDEIKQQLAAIKPEVKLPTKGKEAGEKETLLEQSLEQLAETHKVLDESLEKHRQSEEIFKNYQTELEQTKREKEELQERLRQTEALLERSIGQLDETETVLNQCCEKLLVRDGQREQEKTSKTTPRKYAIVTTFSTKGYQEYGRRMLESFDRHLPPEVDIYAYCEGEQPDFKSSRVCYRDLEAASPDLVEFKKECDRDPVKCGRGGKEYNMQLDARRFAHKTFCVIHATQNTDADIVFWFDADTVALRDVSMSVIESLLPPQYYTSYLGRGKAYSECGFVGYNIKHPANKEFMELWREVYLSGKLFELPQWHDCTSFDYVRTQLERSHKIESNNLSGDLVTGHPFVNTILGEYFDHLKGIKRKKVGKSLPRDFVVNPSKRVKKSLPLSANNTQLKPEMQANYWHPLDSAQVNRYSQVIHCINLFKPTSIIEVGTWNGNRAIDMVKAALAHRQKVHYIGFDLFEDATPQTDAEELNVKKHFTVAQVSARLKQIQASHPGFTFELVKGNTRETLKLPRVADFAFIDGGHSLETIRNDYEAVKGCPAILFDDYYLPDKNGKCPDLQKLGCNEIIKDLPHYVLPILGPIKDGGLTAMALLFGTQMTKHIFSSGPTVFYEKTVAKPPGVEPNLSGEIVSYEGKLGVFAGSDRDKGPFGNYRQFGTWAPALQELLLTKIFPAGSSGTYLDIGAHIGLTVIPITEARKVDSFAFEPEPDNYKLLSQNLATHKLESSIKTYPYALFSEAKEVDLALASNNKGDSRIKIHNSEAPSLKGEASRPIIKVRAERLDDILKAANLKKPIVVKLAIQGAELQFLKGASQFLESVDYLIVQFWPYGLRHLGNNPEALISALEQFPFGAILKHYPLPNTDYQAIKNDVSNLSLQKMTEIMANLRNELPLDNVKYTGHLTIICSKKSEY